MKGFLILFFLVNLISAQKVVKKSFVNNAITSINVDVNDCYKLTMKTSSTNEMSVEAIIDGEYRKDLLLSIIENGNTIMVSTGFQPNFENPNDKLSAHKVISIELKIVLPQYKNVTVFGTSCNVDVHGDYKNLKVSLDDGHCEAFDITENIELHTQSGSIALYASKGTVNAVSKYGKITEEEISNGDAVYNLTSVTGNIGVKKTE